MKLMNEIVTQAMKTGYLTLEAEDQLRMVIRQKHASKEFSAFLELQDAIMCGKVRQQAREQLATM